MANAGEWQVRSCDGNLVGRSHCKHFFAGCHGRRTIAIKRHSAIWVAELQRGKGCGIANDDQLIIAAGQPIPRVARCVAIHRNRTDAAAQISVAFKRGNPRTIRHPVVLHLKPLPRHGAWSETIDLGARLIRPITPAPLRNCSNRPTRLAITPHPD